MAVADLVDAWPVFFQKTIDNLVTVAQSGTRQRVFSREAVAQTCIPFDFPKHFGSPFQHQQLITEDMHPGTLLGRNPSLAGWASGRLRVVAG